MQHKKVSGSPRIREASFDDYPRIIALESQYGLGTKSPDAWKHLWTDNPAYQKLQQSWPIGWVLENDSNRILGYVGNIPLFYEFEERTILVATGRAWVVDSQYRSYSLILMDHFFSQENVDLFLNTTVNAQASKAFGEFQTLRVPVGAWDRSGFWITNYQGFVASSLKMRAMPLARPSSYPLSVALLLKDRLTKKAWPLSRNGVEVKTCASFDDRFDLFWGTLRKANSHLLMAVRSKAMLDWHFKHALLQGRLWILTVSDASGLVAYSIFLRKDNARFGLKRVRLIDFQALDENTGLLSPMLSCALERCRGEGIHMLESVGFCSGRNNILEELAPHRRTLPSWMYFYKANQTSLAVSLKNPEAWNPSLFDGDASL